MNDKQIKNQQEESAFIRGQKRALMNMRVVNAGKQCSEGHWYQGDTCDTCEKEDEHAKGFKVVIPEKKVQNGFENGKLKAVADINNRLNNASQSETPIFSEGGYKIVQALGNTSGAVTMVSPDGKRMPHNSATDARKHIVQLLKESGEYGKGSQGN